jgi:hypothetical protein
LRIARRPIPPELLKWRQGNSPVFNKIQDFPPPKKLLHYVCFFCLVTWGASIIAIASHTGSVEAWFESTRQLAMFSFFGLLTFGFFYIQYAAVESVVGRELNETLGHLQVTGSALLFLAGVVVDLAALLSNNPQFAAMGLGDNILVVICVLGEGMFLVNVVMTYVLAQGAAEVKRPVIPISRPAAPPVRSPIATAQKVAAQLDWSSSPALIFGVTAVFFILVGIFLIERSPAHMPLMHDGALTYVSAGYLWLPLAFPFAVFAVVYWLVEIFTGWTFDRNATRMNFLCTMLAAIDAIRIYWSWSIRTPNINSQLPGAGDFFGVFAFLILAAGTLIWNIWSAQNPPVRSAPLQSR